jgi:hypothetical protein
MFGVIKDWGAFTIGDKVIGHSDSLSSPIKGSGIIGWRHEQGHYYQNLLLGPLYFPLIAIPSLIHARTPLHHPPRVEDLRGLLHRDVGIGMGQVNPRSRV